jgi:hypothetical protein
MLKCIKKKSHPGNAWSDAKKTGKGVQESNTNGQRLKSTVTSALPVPQTPQNASNNGPPGTKPGKRQERSLSKDANTVKRQHNWFSTVRLKSST